jgi:threonine/homoserine/homoserine lactone efflux protein
MSFEIMIALAAAVFVLGITPGPGVFATVARSLAMGFRPTLPFIAGVITGDLIYLAFAVLGLSFIANQFGEVFTVVRVLGGSYLIYLGVRIWRAEPEPFANHTTPRRGVVRGYLSGLPITLGNPKVVLFYIGFIPTFVDLTALGAADIAAMMAIVAATLLVTECFYAYASARARRLFQSRRSVKLLNRGAGGLLTGTGAVVATS